MAVELVACDLCIYQSIENVHQGLDIESVQIASFGLKKLRRGKVG